MRLDKTLGFRASAAVAAAFLLAAGLSGCSSEEPDADPTAQPSVEPSPDASPTSEPTPDLEAPTVWPLTGVEVEEIAQRPAIAVKIENSAAARPQIGLEHADMVWETLAEGGITRFVAVFHSDIPEFVAPVRSVRPTDPAIVAPLGGVLVYSGAQPAFISLVNAQNIQSMYMDRGDPGFARMPGRFAPHNVIGTMATFLANVNDSRTVPPENQLVWTWVPGEGTAITEGSAVDSLVAHMSAGQSTGWVWDEESGTFLRSNNNAASLSDTGEQHAATNVVFLLQDVRMSAADSSVPETVMVGSGQAIVASGGHYVEATWVKDSVDSVLQLLDLDGNPILLEPGATWINQVPSNMSWTITLADADASATADNP